MNIVRRFAQLCLGVSLSLVITPAVQAQVAPVITSQPFPANRSAVEGTRILISVAATGVPPPSFQWRKDGFDIEGATSFILDIPSATVDSAGNYTVVVSNSAGSVTSQPATLTINPKITDAPDSTGVTAGSSVTFSVVATGAPTYQWRKDGQVIPGATGSTLALSNVQASANYDVVVTNAAGSVFSGTAGLTVFSGSPAGTSVSVKAGDAITFNATAAGASPTFQWRRNGTPIAGATGATYHIASVTAADAGNYSVAITTGGTTVTSATTTVDVAPPSVLKDPSDFDPPSGVTVGSSVTFNVLATGAPQFQWRRDGTPIAGATGANLTVVNVQATAEYDVLLTNPSGAVDSQDANLTVNPPDGQPPSSENAVVNVGDSISFNATGQAGSMFQWRKDAAPLAGATETTLTLTAVTPADAGVYSVIITTGGTPLTSVGTQLIVNVPAGFPSISIQPADQSATAGDDVTFSVIASGTPAPTYQWSKNGVDIPGATASSLSLPSVTSASAGDYTVVVSNAAGSLISEEATLTVATSLPGRLINLSIRTSLSGGETLILGTVIGGADTAGTKSLLVRAAGPSLGAAPFNLPNALADPRFDFFREQTVIASNDNWGGGGALTSTFAQVGAFPFFSATSLDAALFNPSLQPGNHSVHVSGVGGAGGEVVAELYDATPDALVTVTTPRLVNVSVLKQVDAGGILTAGFFLEGGGTVLIRAVGPTLANPPFGLGGVMANPRIDLFNAGGTMISSNDNWGGGAALAAAFGSVAAFELPANSLDAALLATLATGAYTAQVSGVGNTGGTVIVEVYEVP